MLLAFTVCGISATGLPDPFHHTNCTCADYCAGSCAINTTDGNYAHNMTLYRMTPFIARDLTNKNTGDIKGDTSFVLSRKDISEECVRCIEEKSTSASCSKCWMSGDNPNSTDLIIEFLVELDGQWGPYEYCNPIHNNHPELGFSCMDTYLGHRRSNCSCPRMNVTVGWQNKSSSYSVAQTETGAGADPCEAHAECGKCAEGTGDGGYHCLWCLDSRTCHSWDRKPAVGCGRRKCVRDAAGRHSNCSAVATSKNCAGYHPAPAPTPHMAKRAMGSWYSHPAGGQCNGTHTVGDGSNCTWRALRVVDAVNATCVYGRIDRAVETHNGSYCWRHDNCSTSNTSSVCYRKCYTATYARMTDEELIKPWVMAFNKSNPEACATVDIPELQMAPHELNPLRSQPRRKHRSKSVE